MDNKMRPHLIEVFREVFNSDNDKRKRVQVDINRHNFQQRRLLAVIKKEMLKYTSLGFDLDIRPFKTVSLRTIEGYEYEFNGIPFSIHFDKRNISFEFIPEANSAGKLQYEFMRYNNGAQTFCFGYLIWSKEKGDSKSHWYLEKNYNTYSLTSAEFDANGIAMLLTNMYTL
ncbi:hypothetical protein RJO36_004062 [Enterobacter hormaechei]|nr:hypothetical protein [Enterobacter hormaechei]